MLRLVRTMSLAVAEQALAQVVRIVPALTPERSASSLIFSSRSIGAVVAALL